MPKKVFRNSVLHIIFTLFLTAGCQDQSRSIHRIDRGISLSQFLNDPDGNSGSFMTVWGIMERDGAVFRISSLDQYVHGIDTSDVFVMVADESFDTAISSNRSDAKDKCLGVRVEVTGWLGMIAAKNQPGIVEVERVFLMGDKRPNDERGSLCYLKER